MARAGYNRLAGQGDSAGRTQIPVVWLDIDSIEDARIIRRQRYKFTTQNYGESRIAISTDEGGFLDGVT